MNADKTEWHQKYNVVLQCGVSSKQTVNEGSDTNRPDRVDFYRFLLDFLAGKLRPPTFERAGRTESRTNFSSWMSKQNKLRKYEDEKEKVGSKESNILRKGKSKTQYKR